MVYRGEIDPHGQALLATGSGLLNSRKFMGYERDGTTGLDYANARMYIEREMPAHSFGSRGDCLVEVYDEMDGHFSRA